MTNELKIHKNKSFEDINYSENKWTNSEFYKCKFIGCNFTESDLRGKIFEDCSFEECNFSMTEIDDVSFRNILFKGCKMLGIDFTKFNNLIFSLRFDSCIMDYCTFFGTIQKRTQFINCSLKDVDFSETDLSLALFTKSDLTRAIFSNTILEGADFRSAINFNIDPESNKVKKAKFSSYQLEGLLYKHQLDIS